MAIRQSPAIGSQMRPMGIGVVAENRVPSANNVVMVTPLELLPMLQGELAQQSSSSEETLTDPMGNPIKATLRTDTAYPMDWWPVDTRIVDAPYLRRGDKVEIYRFADTKQYFWRELSTDRQLRRGERYRIGISANTSEDRGANGLYDDNYVLDINGPGGMVMITTSESNSEAAGYTWSIDAVNGRMFFGDNLGNNWILDTKAKVLRATNSSGTFTEINVDDMTNFGHETVTTEFKNLIDKIKQSIERTAGENITETSGKVSVYKAGERIRLEAPVIELRGQIKFMGPISQSDGGQGYGTNCSFVGNTTWKGTMDATGTWTINGVVVDKHKHPTPNGMSDVPTKG